MSTPTYDLSKVQFTSEANSFKNDSLLFQGSLTLPTSITSHSFNISSQNFTIPNTPTFSVLYGYFQDFYDAFDQYFAGSSYKTSQWFETNINAKVGIIVTAPAPQAGPIEGLIYPTISGNTVTVNLLVNNPYGVTITIAPQTIPYAFITYSLTN